MNARAVRALRLVSVWAAVQVFAGCLGGSPLEESGQEISIDGTWSGVMSNTYVCEGSQRTVELSIAGNSVIVSGGTVADELDPWFAEGTAGTISEQESGRYVVTLDSDGSVPGTFVVDPSGEYGLLAVDTSDPAIAESRNGYVGVVQKAELTTVTYDSSDIVGEWSGTTVRVDSNYQLTTQADSSAVVTETEGLAIEGNDAEGAFSGFMSFPYTELGVYRTRSADDDYVNWENEDQFEALYFLSYDKSVLAVAFVTSLCDLDLFDSLPAQKFALWARE